MKFNNYDANLEFCMLCSGRMNCYEIFGVEVGRFKLKKKVGYDQNFNKIQLYIEV